MNEFQERIGVGKPHYGIARLGPTRQRVVVAEEGPRKGRAAGVQTDYKSGRVDGTAFVDTVKRKISISGRDD